MSAGKGKQPSKQPPVGAAKGNLGKSVATETHPPQTDRKRQHEASDQPRQEMQQGQAPVTAQRTADDSQPEKLRRVEAIVQPEQHVLPPHVQQEHEPSADLFHPIIGPEEIPEAEQPTMAYRLVNRLQEKPSAGKQPEISQPIEPQHVAPQEHVWLINTRKLPTTGQPVWQQQIARPMGQHQVAGPLMGEQHVLPLNVQQEHEPSADLFPSVIRPDEIPEAEQPTMAYRLVNRLQEKPSAGKQPEISQPIEPQHVAPQEHVWLINTRKLPTAGQPVWQQQIARPVGQHQVAGPLMGEQHVLPLNVQQEHEPSADLFPSVIRPDEIPEAEQQTMADLLVNRLQEKPSAGKQPVIGQPTDPNQVASQEPVWLINSGKQPIAGQRMWQQRVVGPGPLMGQHPVAGRRTWQQRMSSLTGQQQAAGPGQLMGQQPEAGPLVQVIQVMQPPCTLQLLQPDELVGEKYKVIKKIGSGGFGQVYEGVEVTNTRPVAIKAMIRRNYQEALLEHEVLRAFHDVSERWDPRTRQRRHPCFFDFFSGIKPAPLTHYQIVMQLLGDTLRKIQKDCPLIPKRLSIPTIYGVMVQCILAIKDLHELGYIRKHSGTLLYETLKDEAERLLHMDSMPSDRDIKPHNFAVGGTDNRHLVYIFDFGLCRKYRDDKGCIVPARPRCGFTGTIRYASREAQNGQEQYRRHDMISLFHSFWEMLTGSLPWTTGSDSDTSNKKKLCLPSFYYSMRPEIQTFIMYIYRTTGDADEPSYEEMCNRFKDLLESTVGTRDENEVEYEWLQPDRCKNLDHWVMPQQFLPLQTGAGQFPQVAEQFPQMVGQLPLGAGQFPQTAGQFPQMAGQFQQAAGPPSKIPGPPLQPPGPSGL